MKLFMALMPNTGWFKDSEIQNWTGLQSGTDYNSDCFLPRLPRRIQSAEALGRGFIGIKVFVVTPNAYKKEKLF